MKENRDLADVFCGINDPKAMRHFLEEIFTPAERKDFTLRWDLMKRLKQGIPQRKIASELGVSLCKITRGARILRNPKSITNRILNQDRHPQ
jgi:TrpR family transcriptional regulator, trp operon repressor